jgi:hypothetical protein
LVRAVPGFVAMFGSFDQVSELDARFWPDDAA